MKICTKCKINKNKSEFKRNSAYKGGYVRICKSCNLKDNNKWKLSKKGVITTIYNSQKESSKKRNHNPPMYILSELREWLFNDWIFNLLYDNWVNCGYLKDMKPSVDRLDDYKGYSLDNIQLMTWKENNRRSHVDRYKGINNKTSKRVAQYNLNNSLISEYYSISEASRRTGCNNAHIGSCCKGKRNTTGGFKWAYV